MGRFDECLSLLLKAEGGYSNDKDDRGGPTNYGITQVAYARWLVAHRLQVEPVKYISRASMEALYKQDYWTPAKCALLAKPIDWVVFDGAVNHSVRQSVKFLQRAVGVDDDGFIGPNTIQAVSQDVAMHGPCSVAQNIIDQRRVFYRELVRKDATQEKFLNGWNNRLDHIEKEMCA